MLDIDIKDPTGKFKLRVCGIVKQDDKILLLKAKTMPGYCLPGGHVELGELTQTAVLREVKEELNIDVEIEKLVCVNENIFISQDGITCHEIGYYYIVNPTTPIEPKDFEIEELDKGVLKRHQFHWEDISTIENIDIKPYFIGKMIKDNVSNLILSTDQR